MQIMQQTHLESREMDQSNQWPILRIHSHQLSQASLLLAMRIIATTLRVPRAHELGREEAPLAIFLELGLLLSEDGPERVEKRVLRIFEVRFGELEVLDVGDGDGGRGLLLLGEVSEAEEVGEVVVLAGGADDVLLWVGVLEGEGFTGCVDETRVRMDI